MAAKTADDVIWNMLKTKQDVLNRAGLFSDDLQEATHTSAPLSVSLAFGLNISKAITKFNYRPKKLMIILIPKILMQHLCQMWRHKKKKSLVLKA